MECTRNRVRDRYFDQLERSGHDRRPTDLDRFARLGIRALRFPILWERTAPNDLRRAEWSWSDERMARLRSLGIRPIVGLVHHGSGPPSTSLIDPRFADGLAAYARAVAERYPYVTDWTPVNEPLTTARFSALYGHWYPHLRDDRAFARALMIQCRATALAMRAIREVIPGARLVQTEDLGRTQSTELLAYQAEFENERRWASLDLLCGRLDRKMPFGAYLLANGVTERDLAWARDHATPPDVIGINHYLTSERYLDERLELFPERSHGGNGRHRYADIEAVRVAGRELAGHGTLLREAWQRFRRPLAITEVHLGCTREEQLRWLVDAWNAARACAEEGLDVRAVTVWSLLGSFGWTSLACDETDMTYEPGPYDVRGDVPRPTALATLARELAAGAAPSHPVLEGDGWWKRPERWLFPDPPPAPLATRPARRERPIAITGAGGTLGRALARACSERGLAHVLVGRDRCDLADAAATTDLLASVRPWAVVNAAGYVRVDDAELEPARCFRENRDGAAALASACAALDVPLATFSTDLVFDGRSPRPYVESDEVAPLGTYGRSKAEAERAVLARNERALVIRTSAFYGPHDEHNFVTLALRALASGQRFAAADDVVISPTYYPALAHAVLDLVVDGERGIWHVSDRAQVTWYELARLAAAACGVDATRLERRSAAELGWRAPRPRNSALASERAPLLPSLDEGLARYRSESASLERSARAA